MFVVILSDIVILSGAKNLSPACPSKNVPPGRPTARSFAEKAQDDKPGGHRNVLRNTHPFHGGYRRGSGDMTLPVPGSFPGVILSEFLSF